MALLLFFLLNPEDKCSAYVNNTSGEEKAFFLIQING